MKIKKFGTSITTFAIISLLTSFAFALGETKPTSSLPPYYLQVPGWQECTKEKDMGSWRSVCIPQKKPAGCLNASWQDLQAKANLPPC